MSDQTRIMSLSPIEKSSLSARLLHLRDLLKAGTLNPIDKARASAAVLAIRRQLGAQDITPPIVDAVTAVEKVDDDFIYGELGGLGREAEHSGYV